MDGLDGTKTHLLGAALDLLHQLAHKTAACGLALALLLPPTVLLPIVPVRVLLRHVHP